VARSIFVAEDDKVARAYGGDDPDSPYRFYMSQLTAKLKKARRMIAFKSHPEMPDEDITFDYIFDNIVIRGSVNRVIDRILELHEQVGDFRNAPVLRQGLGRSAARPQIHGADGGESHACRQLPRSENPWRRNSAVSRKKPNVRGVTVVAQIPGHQAIRPYRLSSHNRTRPPRAASSSCRPSSASTAFVRGLCRDARARAGLAAAVMGPL